MRPVAPRTVLILVAALNALIAAPAVAQTISLSPAVVPLRGARGESTTQTLTLTNGLDVPLTFELVAQDVVVREGVRAFVDAGAEAGSLAATAVFSAPTITVPPGASRSVEVTVTARPSGTLRAIVALFRGRTRIATGKTGAVASLGTLLTFTLSDEVQLTMGALAVQPPGPTTLLTFDDAVSNTGAEPTVTKGVAAVLDAGGRLVGRASFAPKRLLPGERAVLHAEYPGELPAGRYRALATFEYENRAVTKAAEFVVP